LDEEDIQKLKGKINEDRSDEGIMHHNVNTILYFH